MSHLPNPGNNYFDKRSFFFEGVQKVKMFGENSRKVTRTFLVAALQILLKSGTHNATLEATKWQRESCPGCTPSLFFQNTVMLQATLQTRKSVNCTLWDAMLHIMSRPLFLSHVPRVPSPKQAIRPLAGYNFVSMHRVCKSSILIFAVNFDTLRIQNEYSENAKKNWIQPEVTILYADHKDCGLGGQD